MRDFSFLYGPIRTWATALAAVILIAAVVLHYRDDPLAVDCDPGAVPAVAVGADGAAVDLAAGSVRGDCPRPPASCEDDRAKPDVGDDASGCVDPTGDPETDPTDDPPLTRTVSVGATADDADTDADTDADGGSVDPWDGVERSGGDVPFVSLRPSDQPMTDAGRSLIPSTSTVTPTPRPVGGGGPTPSDPNP